MTSTAPPIRLTRRFVCHGIDPSSGEVFPRSEVERMERHVFRAHDGDRPG